MTEPPQTLPEDARDRRGLIALFVDRPVLTLMTAVAILAVGLVALMQLPLRLAPAGMASDEINVWVPVQSRMSPREVEERVVRPFEELLRTIPGVTEISSRASDDTAFFSIELDNQMDPVLASAEVRDRAQRAKLQWPDDVDRYFTWREDASSAPLAFFQIQTPERNSDWDFKLDQVVRPRLEAVDGVGRVEVWGLLDETLRIWIDRDKLVEHRIDFGQLLRKLSQDNFVEPVGELDDGHSRYLVRVDSKFKSSSEIGSYPIAPGLTISDIARIERVPSVRDNLSRYDRKYTYMAILRLQSGTNPVDASTRVETLVDDLRNDRDLAGIDFRFLFDQGAMIEDSLSTLLTTSVQGGLLALIALFLFVRNVRLTVCIAFAIPMALMIAIGYLFFTAQSLNILTMAGMTLAVGMVVDNSVVVLENIRRLREEGHTLRSACVRGTREVVLAISMATLTTVVVILPLIFMGSDNNVRTSLGALGLPLSVALIGSLGIALLLLPAAMRQFGTGAHASARNSVRLARISPVAYLLAFNQALLKFALRHRVIASVGAIAVLATMQIPQNLLEFDTGGGGGPFRGGDITINLEMPRGKTLAQVDEEVKFYEDFLFEHQDEWDIENVSVRFSRRSARVDIVLNDDVERDQFTAYRGRILAEWPRRAGVEVTLRDRGSGSRSATGGEEQDMRNFVVRLWGPDSEYLSARALTVRDRLATLPEVQKIEIGGLDDNEEVIVAVDRERTDNLGVDSQTIAQVMASGLRGRELTRFDEDGREVRLIAQFDAERDPTLFDLRETQVWSRAGTFRELSQLADIRFEKALGSIRRLDGKTYISLVGERMPDVGAREMSGVLESVMGSEALPRGYSWTEASSTNDIALQLRELMEAGGLSIVLVFLLMGILFESVILPGAILITVPFALFGAYWSLLLFYGAIDVMAGIGMLLLCGVVVNNGIVLLDCIERLRRAGMSRQNAILEGTRIRLRPIVMTAITTIAGLVPMALFGKSTGEGVSYVSMSIAVAGGLAFCTVFTAFSVPLAYTFFDDFSNWLRGIWRRAAGRERLEPAASSVTS